MTPMDTNLRDAFAQYVSAYNVEDPKIRLKIDHSYRVADLAEQIAASLDGADPAFAWRIGLLHDIGRFEQVRRYNTFIDVISVDHGQFGADQLLHEGVLEQLGVRDLSEEQTRQLELAIRWHSAYRIPEGLTEQERMYCDILRDADKIDIFRVLCDTPPEEIYDVSTEELKAAAVSDEVKECFLAHTAVLREKRRTAIDKIVGHICLTFELVYPVRREIAQAQGYVDRLLAFPSENEDTAQWFAYMREHIWE